MMCFLFDYNNMPVHTQSSTRTNSQTHSCACVHVCIVILFIIIGMMLQCLQFYNFPFLSSSLLFWLLLLSSLFLFSSSSSCFFSCVFRFVIFHSLHIHLHPSMHRYEKQTKHNFTVILMCVYKCLCNCDHLFFFYTGTWSHAIVTSYILDKYWWPKLAVTHFVCVCVFARRCNDLKCCSMCSSKKS